MVKFIDSLLRTFILQSAIAAIVLIVANRKQFQVYREQIQIPFTVSLNLFAITDNYDNYNCMRTRHTVNPPISTATLIQNISNFLRRLLEGGAYFKT